jgi:NAD(P)-dependent dehydrogenase (short-subunit alcohol dehydrogenase family)
MMPGRLEGRAAIGTRGNSGIGAATGECFARKGAKVVLAARREAEGQEVEACIREAGGEATFARCNVMDPAQLDHLVEETAGRHGGVGVLSNNADRYFNHVQLSRRPGLPDAVANTVRFLACDESRFINGQIINVDGGAAGKV